MVAPRRGEGGGDEAPRKCSWFSYLRPGHRQRRGRGTTHTQGTAWSATGGAEARQRC